MTAARLWWDANRSLLLLLAGVAVVGSAAGIVYSATVTCAADLKPADCARFLNANPVSTAATAFTAILPIIGGLVFGVDAVGREIESRTAAFAWSVAGSRRRWLAERIAPGLLATAGLGLLCGAANAVVVANLNPGHQIVASFVGYGLWGPILVVRALCGYAIGLCLGLVIGRVMASVALGLIVVAVVAPAALVVGRSFEPAQILRNGDTRISDALGVEFGALAPDGELIEPVRCQSLAPPGLDSTDLDAWIASNCPIVSSYLLGTRMPIVEFREATTLALVGLVFGGVAFAGVANRRP